jgi:hypothetical protein
MTLFMFYKMAKTVGKEQPARSRTYFIGIVMPCVMMLINLLFMFQALISGCSGYWILLILGGFGLGYFWGRSSKLYKKGADLVVKRTVLHLVIWAASYSLTQLLATIVPASIVAGGLATMFFSTGSSIGMNTNLLLRQRKLKTTPSAVSSQ